MPSAARPDSDSGQHPDREGSTHGTGRKKRKPRPPTPVPGTPASQPITHHNVPRPPSSGTGGASSGSNVTENVTKRRVRFEDLPVDERIDPAAATTKLPPGNRKTVVRVGEDPTAASPPRKSDPDGDEDPQKEHPSKPARRSRSTYAPTGRSVTRILQAPIAAEEDLPPPIAPVPNANGTFVEITVRSRTFDTEVPGWPDDPAVRLVGSSWPMQEVFLQAQEAAETGGAILLVGEAGVGKYSLARAIHAASARASEGFFSEPLAGDDPRKTRRRLFGVDRLEQRWGVTAGNRGLLGYAACGTLYFYMLHLASPELQALLAQALTVGVASQGRRIRPAELMMVLSMTAPVEDMELRVRGGTYNASLWEQLEDNIIEIPPLRERADDIPELTDFFLARIAAETQGSLRRVSSRCRKWLAAFPWPGNVGQLEAACRQAYRAKRQGDLEPEDFMASLG